MKRVTQEDVAREVGVSRTLVSYAYRGVGGVSSQMRDRIFDAGKRLGYRRDIVASQLASRRSNTLGLVLLDLNFEINTEIFRGVQAFCERADHRLVLTIGGVEGRRDRTAMEDLLDMRVEAVVIAGAVVPDAYLQELADRVPLVVVTRQVPGVDSVAIDDIVGGRMATEHLLDLGHRAVAHIATPAGYPYRARAAGYERAMRDRGLAPRVVDAGFDQASGAGAAAELLDSDAPPTAVFCNNDLTALGVFDLAAERGIRIPEDLSVVGFDDTHAASLPRVALTSVGQQAFRLGEAAGERAAARAVDRFGQPEAITLEPHLVVRSSTSAPRREARLSRSGGSRG